MLSGDEKGLLCNPELLTVCFGYHLQGHECGEISECGNASVHGAGGDVLEHPHVPMVENLSASNLFFVLSNSSDSEQ